MTEFQFCYWMMGFFELNTPQMINEKQFELIEAHIKLVKNRKHSFCDWIEGACEINNSRTFDERQTQKILDKLKDEFLKVIDKSYPENQHLNLQKAHNPKFMVMC